MANNYQNPPGQWHRPHRAPTIAELLGCSPDYGDPQLAYRILGLHSTQDNPNQLRPSAREFTEWCNHVSGEIWTEASDPSAGSVGYRRAVEANRRVLSAINTLAGIRRPKHQYWKPTELFIIEDWDQYGQCFDVAHGLTENNWNDLVVVPMSYQMFRDRYRVVDQTMMAKNEPKKRKAWKATWNMICDAEEREKKDFVDIFPCYGFRAQPVYKYPGDKSEAAKDTLVQKFYAAPVPRNENSLWYSLALLVESTPTEAKSIKAKLADWFYKHLSDPLSPRFRMYCQLLADSSACVGDVDEYHWGPLDMLRCLNVNSPDAGMPKEAGFHEMLHLVADFFDTEVITFTRPPDINLFGSLGYRDMAAWIEKKPYEMRVYGRPASQIDYKLKFQERKQILLVTDSDLRYFQPVIRIEPDLPRYLDPAEVEAGQYINTDQFDEWDRYAPMPWWPGYHWDALRDPPRWSGNWDVKDLRDNLLPAQRQDMAPSDITTTNYMDAITGNQALGPYWAMQSVADGPGPAALRGWMASYCGDADTDRPALQLQTPEDRLLWRTSRPRPTDPADAPLVMRDFEARNGNVKVQDDVRFKSKGESNAYKRWAEDWLYQVDPVYHPKCGYMRLATSDKKSNLPCWHANKRRRI